MFARTRRGVPASLKPFLFSYLPDYSARGDLRRGGGGGGGRGRAAGKDVHRCQGRARVLRQQVNKFYFFQNRKCLNTQKREGRPQTGRGGIPILGGCLFCTLGYFSAAVSDGRGSPRWGLACQPRTPLSRKLWVRTLFSE